jgi:Tfp pilus assembly PilM family ATPase
LNIFVPATEFNVIRSIVASLDKRVISLIPSPLVLPKLIEYSEYVEDTVCIIDIGYMHTTLLLQSNNEILSFETFSVGTERLMQMLLEKYEEYSPIQIENMLYGKYDSEMEGVIEGFLQYVADILFGFIGMNESLGDFRKIFCHGGIFQNEKIHKQFSNTLNALP